MPTCTVKTNERTSYKAVVNVFQFGQRLHEGMKEGWRHTD